MTRSGEQPAPESGPEPEPEPGSQTQPRTGSEPGPETRPAVGQPMGPEMGSAMGSAMGPPIGSKTGPEPRPGPRLLLADAETLVAEGLRRLLEPTFTVVGLCGDGRALVELAAQLRPDAVLLEINLPGLGGLDAAAQLRTAAPASGVLFVTSQSDLETVREALRCGATGYVLKRSPVAELHSAVHEVLRGRVYLSPQLQREASAQKEARGAARTSALTQRQREVLRLVAAGHPDKEIASLLHVSEKTVEFHKAGIRRQLSLRGTAEMTRYAIKHGLTQD